MINGCYWSKLQTLMGIMLMCCNLFQRKYGSVHMVGNACNRAKVPDTTYFLRSCYLRNAYLEAAKSCQAKMTMAP